MRERVCMRELCEVCEVCEVCVCVCVCVWHIIVVDPHLALVGASGLA